MKENELSREELIAEAIRLIEQADDRQIAEAIEAALNIGEKTA